MSPTILIYSQDPDFFLIFGHILAVAGFETRLVHNEQETLPIAAEQRPAAVVMDCQPDDASTALTCQRLKSDPTTRNIPVAALIAPSAGLLHVDLIKAGVDETFSRPFAPEKLLSWLNAKVSARDASIETTAGDLVFGDFRLERRGYRVFFQDVWIAMPPIEFKLLRHLMARPGIVFSREDLIEAAWPEHATDADLRSVDVHIAKLRKTLKKALGRDVIRTVRSAGYSFAPHW
ncbi:response regulator transcription factor [Neomesorhizobium albiziae]|nr:response regulator transcription factor [Mesorhizobium albiziae]